jgi:O-antigen ligase
LLYPLLLRPELLLSGIVALLALFLAGRSPAYPVALAAFPFLVLALTSPGAIPDNAIALGVFGWIMAGIAIQVVRGEVLVVRALLVPAVALTLGLVVLMTVRLGSSPAPEYGSFKLQLFVAANLALLVAGIVVGSRRDHFDTYVAVTAIAATIAALLLVQGLVTGTAEAFVGGRFALTSAYSPIEFGRAIGLGILVATYLSLTAGWVTTRALALMSLPVLFVAFFAAGSRGPVVGLLVGVVALVALLLRDVGIRARFVLPALAAIPAAILVGRVAPGENVERALSVLAGPDDDVTANGRVELWAAAWELFVERPLLGLGTGGFADAFPSALYPHNLFLEAAAELGIAGLLLVVAFTASGFFAALHAYRSLDPEVSRRAALVTALLASALTNAAFSGNISSNAAVWLAVGLAVGLAESKRVASAGTNEP